MFTIEQSLIDTRKRKIYQVEGRCLAVRSLLHDGLANSAYVASNNDHNMTFLYVRHKHETELYRATASHDIVTLNKFPTGSGAVLYPFESCTVANSRDLIVLLGALQEELLVYIYKISDSTAETQKLEKLPLNAKIFCSNERFYVYYDEKVFFFNAQQMQLGEQVLISPVRPKGDVTIYERDVYCLFVGQEGVWVFTEGIFSKLQAGMSSCWILGRFLVNSQTEMLSELQRIPTYRELEFINYRQSKAILELGAQ